VSSGIDGWSNKRPLDSLVFVSQCDAKQIMTQKHKMLARAQQNANDADFLSYGLSGRSQQLSRINP